MKPIITSLLDTDFYKILVPSDALTDDDAIIFHNWFKGKVKVVTAGIGTFLTNDVLPECLKLKGVKPLNMVIKMTNADFGCGTANVVKLSDTHGKHIGNAIQVNHIKRELRIDTGYCP